MKALVTGSAGFIGRHVVAALEDAGYDMAIVDIAADGPIDAREFFRYGHLHYDLVVHCAAVVGGRKVMDRTPVRHAQNLEIDAALFGWAARTRPGRVVYFSSSCAYPAVLGCIRDRKLNENDIDLGNPRWPDQLYGWAKLTGELLAGTVRDTGVNVSVVRPFSVYGPGMKEGFAVRGFAEQVARRADPVEVWGNAQQVRDYIHVSDVANAVLAIAQQGIDGPVNLGTGRGTSLAELVALMGSAAGYSPQVTVNAGMPAGVPSLVADSTLLRSFCPPQVTLEDGLAQMVAAR